MSPMGLGCVKTFWSAEFLSRLRGRRRCGGYALMAAISGRAPMMFITLVML